MLSECRAIAERMNCECHSRLNFWAVQNSGSDQISPLRSLAFVCERQRTSANAERMLNYYWANWYESGAIGQFCKRFTFANGYSLKWDRALSNWDSSSYAWKLTQLQLHEYTPCIELLYIAQFYIKLFKLKFKSWKFQEGGMEFISSGMKFLQGGLNKTEWRMWLQHYNSFFYCN